MAQSPRPHLAARSAGGVVVRGSSDAVEFLAVRPAGSERWQLPKGMVDRGESTEGAALREVREEGGVEAAILLPLGGITYFFHAAGRRIRKTVDFYLMGYMSGDPADHDREVEEARWLAGSEVARLTFPSEREVVQRALRAYRTL